MSISRRGGDRTRGRNVLGVDWNAAVLTCPEQERHKKSALACNFPAISPREVMKVYD